MKKLNAKQLRDLSPEHATKFSKKLNRNPIYFILENIYDTYNVGGIFRLADALKIEKIFLCGEMETPPNHKIAKASIGTYKIVSWEYKESAQQAIKELRAHSTISDDQLKNHESEKSKSHIKIIAIEQDNRSVPYQNVSYSYPVAFVLGNETFGVLKETLEMCDHVVEIPMWGTNTSLNVIVSGAIVSYEAMRQFQHD